MITFTNHFDERIHDAPPQVAKLELSICTGLSGAPYESVLTKYICIGTDYGYIHTSGGDVRTWDSYSGARKFLVRYCIDHEMVLPAIAKGTGTKKESN